MDALLMGLLNCLVRAGTTAMRGKFDHAMKRHSGDGANGCGVVIRGGREGYQLQGSLPAKREIAFHSTSRRSMFTMRTRSGRSDSSVGFRQWLWARDSCSSDALRTLDGLKIEGWPQHAVSDWTWSKMEMTKSFSAT